MLKSSACLPRAFLGFLILALVACGGGGGDSSGGGSSGGGGGGGGGGGSGSGAFTVKLDRSTMAFSFTQGAAVPAQVLTATWTGTVPSALYILAQDDANHLDTTIPIQITQTNATITVKPSSLLTGGTYTGHLIMSACADPQCVSQFGGSPATISYTITVNTPVFTGAPTWTWQYVLGETQAGPSVVLNIGNGGAWSATASAPWMALSSASGTGAGRLTVAPDGHGMAPGSYSGTVSVSNGGGTQTSNFTIVITRPVFRVTPASSTYFSGTNGTPFTSPVAVNVSVDYATAIPVTITGDQPWIVVSNAPSTVPGGFSVNVDPARGAQASGSHNGNVHVVLGAGADAVSMDVPVTLNLTAPTFTVSPANLTLGGASGRDFSAVPVTLSLNTGNTAYPWTVTGAPAWLNLDATFGTVASTAQTINLTPLRAQSTVGTATATLTFSATVNGDVITQTVPLSFNLDGHRLIAAETGVALVSTPNAAWKRLTHDVKIRSNFDLPIPWTAQSDQAWLNVTASGTGGGNLTLTADPTGLTANQLYTATVTISSSDTSAANERIRVGLWVAAATPSTVPASFATFTGAQTFNAIVADPIRPYCYAHEIDSTSVRVFNLYTGQELAPIAGFPAKTVSLTVSNDGDKLYGLMSDFTNLNAATPYLQTADLNTMQAGAQFTFPTNAIGAPNELRYIRYVRNDGVGLIFDDNGFVFRAGDGSLVSGRGVYGYFTTAVDGTVAFQGTARYPLSYTDAGGDSIGYTLGASNQNHGLPDDNVPDVTNVDGSRVCVSLLSNQVACFNGADMSDRFVLPAAGSFINGVAMGSDGRIDFTPGAAGAGVSVYSASGVALTSIPGGAGQRGLVVSSDGFILGVASGPYDPAGQLVIAPVGP